MQKTIYFDMDGTIANLYNVENWLHKLTHEDVSPYVEAAAMVDNISFQEACLSLQAIGYKIGVISWTSKNGSKEYNSAVNKAKKEWLKSQFPLLQFNEIHIVKYGTRKDYIAKDKSGVLFDDNDEVRDLWRGRALNPNWCDIVEELQKIDLSGLV